MAAINDTDTTIPLRPFGGSGRQVSCLGLGMAALGRPGYINEGHGADLAGRTDRISMKANSHAVLDAAYRWGIRYFDAARSYGEAEAFLGAWLDQQTASESVVGSKWGYTYVADWRVDAPVHEIKDHSVTTFLRHRRETARTLGDNLDLYQIHSVTPDSPVLTDAETIEKLAACKNQGLLIGLSTSGPRQADVIRQALTVTVESELLFDSVQSTWNVLEPSAGPALTEASEAGLGVIVKEALANGRLTQRGDYAKSLSSADGASLDAVALASALAQPFASVVLSGATTVDQLHSNLAAIDVEPIDHLSPIDPLRYWAERSQRSWT